MAKRQFIWVMTDTTGYNMVGCYGSAIQTPNIDDMAQRGTRFHRAYTCQPVCAPARSAMFTGMYPHSNGCWGNSMPLGADVKTIGQRLSAQGIRCAFIGKWHLDAGDYFGNGICPEGWDAEYWYDMKRYLDELTQEERLLSRDASSSDRNIPESFTYGYRVTQRALAFLEQYQNEDFFLVVSYDEPHGPSLAPEPFASMYGKGVVAQSTPAWDDPLEEKPRLQRLWAEDANGLNPNKRTRGIHSRLAACNTFIDGQIGRVMQKARALAPDSVRLFTSDHGEASHAHGLSGKGPAVYDEITRVPLIFEGGCVAKGAVYPNVVSQIDLAATVLDCMGLEKPVGLQGNTLLPVLKDPAKDTARYVFIEFNRYEIDHDGFGGFQPMRAVITNEYKLAIHLLDGDELYDTRSDPFDLHNLIRDPTHALARDLLHEEILAWMNRTRDPFRGYQWRCRAWRDHSNPLWRVDGYTRQRDNEPGEPRQLDYNTGLAMEHTTRKK